MALRISTGVRDDMLSKPADVSGIHQGAGDTATTVSGSPDTITRVSGSWITDGFVAGDLLTLKGHSADDVAVTGKKVAGVVALTLTLEAAASVAGAAFGAAATLIAATGGSLKDIFRNGVLKIYSGSQPTDPNNAVAGTLLALLTLSSAAFTEGLEGGGLEFDDSVSGVIAKCSEEVWSGLGVAAGTASWFRLCGNATDAGALSTVLPRIDGTVGVSGADATISNTQIVVDAPYTVDTFALTFPMQYGA